MKLFILTNTTQRTSYFLAEKPTDVVDFLKRQLPHNIFSELVEDSENGCWNFTMTNGLTTYFHMCVVPLTVIGA